MGKRVCHYVWDNMSGDKLYDLSDPVLNQDDRIKPLYLLKKHLETCGIEIHTQDILTPEDADLILFENCPPVDTLRKIKVVQALGKPMILNATESIFVMPSNNDPKIFNLFDLVFTYQDRLLEDEKFRKFNYTFSLPSTVPRSDFSERKLLCSVSGNKRVGHKGELYSKRVEVYRWFEKNVPEEFDFYGTGWERPWKAAAPLFKRKILHKWPFRPFFAPPFSSWKGAVESKVKTFEGYRFVLCFENASGVSGYVTEKVFDAMLAGCIPVYWGAENVTDHIPENCLIDYRKLKTPDALYKYLSAISEEEYTETLNAIDSFLGSEKSDQFRNPFFVNSLVHEICELLDLPFVLMREGQYA